MGRKEGCDGLEGDSWHGREVHIPWGGFGG